MMCEITWMKRLRTMLITPLALRRALVTIKA
jgi:hypothetical protein